MKKALTVLLAALMVASLFISCGEDPFFHHISLKYEDKILRTEIVGNGDVYTLPKEVDGIPEISGWTIDGKEYDVGEKITVTGDITIIAVIGTPVVITLYDEVTETVYLRNGETEVTLPEAPKRDGYEFDGWDVGGTKAVPGAKVTYSKDLKIKAVWTKINTITIDNGDGTEQTVNVREDAKEITLPKAPTRDGYVFAGWKIGETTYEAEGKAPYTEGMTITGVWKKLISITVDNGDGTEQTVNVREDAKEITLPKAPTRDGYVFAGWKIGETTYEAEGKAPYTEGMEITAVWKKIYTVTYNANGGSGTVEADTFKEGSDGVKIKDGTGLSKEGFSFASWNTQTDGSGTTYESEVTYKENADLTLYAIWKQGYSVSFDLNGGTGTADPQTVESGKTASEPAKPKMTNAVFSFWSKDGTNEFSFDTEITEDTELKAVWKTTFQVGDTGPAGGIIFYVADTEQTSTYTASDGTKQEHKWRYLEVATGNAEIGGNLSYIWGESSSLTTGSDIGSGWSNQKALEADTTNTYPAAQACADYGNNTDYDDWFLPSKNELNEVYGKKTEIGSFGVGLPYLSSSSDSSKAWGQDFSNGNQTEVTLGSSSRGLVRPIRSFSSEASSSDSGSSSGSTTPVETGDFKVTFDLNGGTGTAEAQTVKSGEKASEPAKPKMTNAVFSFWSKDGTNEFSFDTEITEDTELKAVWKTTFQVGDTGPAGGIIFYINTDTALDWTYLEAAPADVTGEFAWGPDTQGTSYGTETGIGKGKSNTEKVLALTGDFEAFKACADYGNNTDYDDWFLPSKDELNLMYTELKTNGLGGTWTQNYWSSSEQDDWDNRWAQYFDDGSQKGMGGEGNSYCVRPIRSFSSEASSSGSGSSSGSTTPAETGDFKVTFDLNGGTGTADPQTVESGKTASEPAKPKMTNAVFSFWSKDGTNEFSFDTEITEDTELKAVWKTTFQVGDTGPAGGIIFYVADTEQTSTYGTETFKWKYLEAASSDATYYNASTFSWGDNGSFGTGTAIGDGWVNARKFEADTEGNVFMAAQVCFAYGNDTDYDDWFLPSKYELKAMYDNIGSRGTWSFQYWSSSESGSTAVFAKYFSTDPDFGDSEGFDSFGRDGKRAVRPVRAFAEVTASSGSSGSSSGSATTYTAGSTVELGTYNNQPVTWRVLEVDTANSRALVISENILESLIFDADAQAYSGSDIQTYLNGDFITTYGLGNVSICNVDVTSNIEETAVGSGSDKVFLLSKTEAENTSYFADQTDRVANYDGTAYRWWLRTPDPGNMKYVCMVYKNGYITECICYYADGCGLRPAMWVNF